MAKTPVWQMVREATSSIQSDVFSMSDIIDSVRKLYGNVNTGTIRTQVNVCTVNLKGRASMPENSKPRIADGKYDFLFSVGRGQFTLYDPQKHGVWQLVDRAGKMTLAKKATRKSASKTPVWQMIREAVDALDSEVITVADIIDLVKSRYGSVNEGTIRAQALACTVNRQSRVHMPENHKPRIANGQYDFLFSVGHGKVAKYIPAKHGVWEIAQEDGKRIVRIVSGSGLHATISDRKLRRPPGRKLLAYRIDREPLPPCKVRVKGQPLRGGLTRQAGWHGGHSQSIPAAISCKHQHTTGGRPCLIYAGSMTRISRKML